MSGGDCKQKEFKSEVECYRPDLNFMQKYAGVKSIEEFHKQCTDWYRETCCTPSYKEYWIRREPSEYGIPSEYGTHKNNDKKRRDR